MNLFVNTYTDADPERNQELQDCLSINKQHPMLTVYELSGRPTYNDFFTYINGVTQPEEINIIINSDIYFKDLGYNQFTNLDFNSCYALTRWEILEDGAEQFYNNSGSQDAWIFRGKIKPVKGADFTQGVAGCDNKIAYLLEQAGYKVTNPSLSIKTYHLHKSDVRHYNKIPPGQKDIYRLPRPRVNVKISTL